MRVITLQGLGAQEFVHDLRETLSRETPLDAEVHVVAKPEACQVETRVVLDGGSATRTISFRNLGDLPEKRLLDIVRELTAMPPIYRSSHEANMRSASLSGSDNPSFRQAISSNGYHHKSKFLLAGPHVKGFPTE